MLGLHLTLSPSLEIQINQNLMLCGGATESIFPRAEALLMNGGDYHKALCRVAEAKNMHRYKSVMDFLFCEIFTKHRRGCFKYYRDEGPKLMEIITVEEMLYSERVLLLALEMAHERLKEDYWRDHRASWCRFQSEVLKAAA